jgi:hypothetical protein
VSLPTNNAARKALPIWAYMFGYFPDAFLAEVEVAVAGNDQHNKGEPLHWAREKSTDQLNTALRHQFDYAKGVKKDVDGTWHLAKAIWRLKAQLQLDIEADKAERDADVSRDFSAGEGSSGGSRDPWNDELLREDLQRHVSRSY